MEDLVFVSYAREDGEFAQKLAKDLRAANVNLWIDRLDIKAGETWDRAVEDALHSCKGLLVILSPSSVSSRSVMDEVSFAIEENKKVVPVLYQVCDVPFRLRRVQHTDFTSNYSNGLELLIEALQENSASIGDTPTTINSPSPSSGATAESSIGRGSASGKSPRSPLRLRLVAALFVGLVAAFLGGLAELLIYANDERIGTSAAPSLLYTTVGGGLVTGLLWAIAGAIAGPRPFPLMSALGVSVVVLVIWISVWGVYADVLGAAVVVGWPVGGIIGAIIGVAILGKSGMSG